MTDETRTVVAALHRLSDDVAEPPTVLTDAYRRAGQLRRRHRGILAAVLVLAVTAAGAGAQWFAATWHGPNRTAGVTAEDLLTQPTHGDLAGDAELRARAVTAWRANPRNVPRLGGTASYDTSLALFQLSGAPTVLLAQQTPAGPAVIVVQRAVPANRTPEPTISGQHVDLTDEDQPIVTIGFLTAGTGRTLTVVDTGQLDLTRSLPGLAFLAGADRSWLVVLSEGGPLGLSTHRTYHQNGKITREWQPIKVNAGIGVVAVPAGTDPEMLAVAAMPVTRFQDNVPIGNPPPYQGPRVVPPSGDHQLLWSEPGSLWHTALWVLPDDRSAAAAWGVSTLRSSGNGWASPTSRVVEAWEGAYLDATSDLPTGEGGSHYPAWYAYGALPDGRGFVLGDAQSGDDPSYLYGAIWDHGKRTDLYGGKVDPTAVLPVKFRFPDGQGWLVAAKGATFQYLTDTWHDAGSNAALLPANATEVRVTSAGGAAVVPLG